MQLVKARVYVHSERRDQSKLRKSLDPLKALALACAPAFSPARNGCTSDNALLPFVCRDLDHSRCILRWRVVMAATSLVKNSLGVEPNGQWIEGSRSYHSSAAAPESLAGGLHCRRNLLPATLQSDRAIQGPTIRHMHRKLARSNVNSSDLSS